MCSDLTYRMKVAATVTLPGGAGIGDVELNHTTASIRRAQATIAGKCGLHIILSGVNKNPDEFHRTTFLLVNESVSAGFQALFQSRYNGQ